MKELEALKVIIKNLNNNKTIDDIEFATTEQQYAIQKHIEKKKGELDEVKYFWQIFLEWNDLSKFSEATFADVQTKVGSRIAQIEISIRDHEKLLAP